MAGQGLSSSSGKNPLSFDRGMVKDIGLDAGFWEAKRGGGSYKFELDMKRKRTHGGNAARILVAKIQNCAALC